MKFIQLCFFASFVFLFNIAQAQNNNVQTLTYSHGKYIGEVLNGKAHGQGTYTAAKTGNVYSGQFANDTFSGQGTMLWPNGDRFVGTWKNDSAISGTMTFASGKTASGTVRNGIFKDASSESTSVATTSNEDPDSVGKCLGYLASQIRDGGAQSLHPTHRKYFANHQAGANKIQSLTNQYGSCLTPGTIIRDCLNSKGVSQRDIALMEGFNTGLVTYRQGDNPTKAIFAAACMN